MRRPLVSLAIGGAIAAAAAWLLLSPETLRALRTAAATADRPALTLALLLSAVVQWLRAWRFAVIMDGTSALPSGALVRIAFLLNALNFILPFRLGEFSYPVLMQRTFGQPVLEAAGVLLWARLIDLCTVGAILAGAAAALGLFGGRGASAALSIGALAFLVAPAILALAGGKLLPRLRRFARRDTAAAILAEDTRRHAFRRSLPAALVLSVMIWLVFGVLAALAAGAVTPRIAPAVALLGAAAGNLAFALPVNGIGGFGPSQAAWVAAVTQAGVGWNDAVVSALALYAVTLTGALLFGGLAFFVGRRP